MPDMTLLPAHGPVTTSLPRAGRRAGRPPRRAARAVRWRLSTAGARTAWEVAGLLPWTRHERNREELGPFDGVLAAFETLAHLELLALQGKVGRVDGPTVEFAPLPPDR